MTTTPSSSPTRKRRPGDVPNPGDLRAPSSARAARRPRVDDVASANADWRRASNLDAPEPRPGFVQMWIRVEVDGKPDGRNYSRKFREGWRPRLPESVPEGLSPPTMRHGNQTVIGAQGMVLCEMPKSAAAKRRLFYKTRTQRQMQAVEQNLMRAAPTVMQNPDTELKSVAKRGKRASIAED